MKCGDYNLDLILCGFRAHREGYNFATEFFSFWQAGIFKAQAAMAPNWFRPVNQSLDAA